MRTARVTSPGCVHHVIARCIEERWLITNDEERERYLDFLARSLSQTDWRCLAYAVMSNHVHLAMLAGELPASSWLRRVHPPFANWFNWRHERIGPFFSGRPDMWISRDDQVARLVAYIHNNPVRGGVVARASDCRWTSHRAYLHKEERPWLSVDDGLGLSGVDAKRFDVFVNRTRGDRLEYHELVDLRRAAQHRGALELATPTRTPLRVDLVARPVSWLRPDPRSIIDVVCAVTGVQHDRVRLRRAQDAMIARSVVVRVGRAFGVPMSETGAALGISAGAASRLAGRVLDQDADAIVRLVFGRIHSQLEAALSRKGESVPA